MTPDDPDLDFVKGDLEERRSYYKGVVNYEALLANQINRIADYRSKKFFPQYESAVDTLILMMPTKSRNKALEHKKERDVEYNLSNNGKALYDELWRFSSELLEKDNLIFKTGTFEVGRA